jgi:hypothetical protein
MIAYMMNNEKINRKKLSLERLRITTKTSVRTAGFLVEI